MMREPVLFPYGYLIIAACLLWQEWLTRRAKRQLSPEQSGRLDKADRRGKTLRLLLSAAAFCTIMIAAGQPEDPAIAATTLILTASPVVLLELLLEQHKLRTLRLPANYCKLTAAASALMFVVIGVLAFQYWDHKTALKSSEQRREKHRNENSLPK